CHEPDGGADQRDHEEADDGQRPGDIERRLGDAGGPEPPAGDQELDDLSDRGHQHGADGDCPCPGASGQPRPEQNGRHLEYQPGQDGDQDPGEAHQDHEPDDDLADRIHGWMVRQPPTGAPAQASSPGNSDRALMPSSSPSHAHRVAASAAPKMSRSRLTSAPSTAMHLQPKAQSGISSKGTSRGQSSTAPPAPSMGMGGPAATWRRSGS